MERKHTGEDGEPGTLARDALGLPFTTLIYANGPGYVGATTQSPEGPKSFAHSTSGYQAATQGRPDLTDVDTEHPDFLQEAMVPLSSESHGGDDVGIWARGPGSEAVRGSVEQNTIYHFMLQAMPVLREAQCAQGFCNREGVPVTRPPWLRTAWPAPGTPRPPATAAALR